MTNLLVFPVTQSVRQGRRIVNLAARVASPLVGSARSTARSTMWFAPTLVVGSAEQMVARLPDVIARQFPARAAEVDQLEARVARLEAAAAAESAVSAPKPSTKSAPRPRSAGKTKANVKAAPRARTSTARKGVPKARASSVS